MRSGQTRSGSAAGYAMIPVLVFTVVSFFALTAAYDQLHQLFAYEESSDRIPSTSDGIQEALGHGLARLQTGEPTVGTGDRYRCDLSLRDSSGALVKYKLTYRKLADNEWSLQAEPAGTPEPTCPPAFTDNACPAPLP